MPGTTKCPFCGKLVLAVGRLLIEDGVSEIKCDCSGFQQNYYCHKNGCSNAKVEESYCSQHANCCRYDRGYQTCENGVAVGEYCERHADPCKRCGDRNWVKDGYCEDHRCWEYNCNREVSARGSYCSDHIKSCPHCSRRTTEYKESCDECVRKYKCKYSSCSTIVPHPGGYCSSHKERCHEDYSRTCSKRVSNYGYYCEDHKKKCEFEDCTIRINNYSNHCSQHPLQEQARLYKEGRTKERNEKNTLQTQLTTANNRLNIKQQEIE